ncbi:MAG: hypothetical protein J6I56_10325 [Lachnospiraceae bacterium]|nr:hypothetical protein [Lachnospiraceae bacterium]
MNEKMEVKALHREHNKVKAVYLAFLAAIIPGAVIMYRTSSAMVSYVVIASLIVAYFFILMPMRERLECNVQGAFLHNTLGGTLSGIHYDPDGGITDAEFAQSGFVRKAELGYVTCYKRITGVQEKDTVDIGVLEYGIKKDKQQTAVKAVYIHLHDDEKNDAPIIVTDKNTILPEDEKRKELLIRIRELSGGNYSLRIEGSDAYMLLPDRDLLVKTPLFKDFNETELITDRLPELAVLGELFKA